MSAPVLGRAAPRARFGLKLFGHRLNATATIGIAIIAVNVLAALFAPLLAPYGQADIVGDAWADPDRLHWLGLDNLGRDILSRLLYGARVSIGLSVLITCLAFILGIMAGFSAAALGGWVDSVLSRLVDLLLSMPLLIFAFIVLSVLGTDIPVLIGTIAILNSTLVFRLSRAVAMNLAALEYVEAAKVRGEGLWWVIRREILPNAIPPLVAEFGLRFCFVLLLVAALSFLGLGIQPPLADWGSMVKDYSSVFALVIPGEDVSGGYAPLYPAGAIALLTVGVNFVVDWMLAVHSRGHGEGA